jgi:hypothetical protein
MSAPEKAKASVLLNLDPNSPIGNLVGAFSHSIVLEDGRTILHMWCTEVDPSRPVYLAVTALDAGTEQEASYLIPHHLVAMVVDLPLDPENIKKIGFV